MHQPDDIDREILALLVEDGRRPYSDIAERVGLSAPAVSNRVDRLRERGIVEGVTVTLDHAQFGGGVAVLVTLDPAAGDREQVAERLRAADAVEHLFVTADGRVLVQGRVPDTDVQGWLNDHLDTVPECSVTLLSSVEWTPTVPGGIQPTCDECDNTVTAEGTSARIGGERYEFCCASCETRFRERHERLTE
jgi:DNA-binding Lrp family transcriptional regulator